MRRQLDREPSYFFPQSHAGEQKSKIKFATYCDLPEAASSLGQVINSTKNKISSLKVFQRSSFVQEIYSLYRFRRFVSELIRTLVNKRKSRKRGEHSASFPSSPKINRMLYTKLLCIQWKFTTPDQLASPSKFCSLRLFFFFRPLKYLNLVFQSNQHFQTKEFLDWPVPEEFDNVRNVLFYGHEVL